MYAYSCINISVYIRKYENICICVYICIPLPTDEQLEHKVLASQVELSNSEAWNSIRGQRVYQNRRLCTLFHRRTEAKMQAVEVLPVGCPQARRDSPARKLDATARQHLALTLLKCA